MHRSYRSKAGAISWRILTDWAFTNDNCFGHTLLFIVGVLRFGHIFFKAGFFHPKKFPLVFFPFPVLVFDDGGGQEDPRAKSFPR
jgi:hypothetical protein